MRIIVVAPLFLPSAFGGVCALRRKRMSLFLAAPRTHLGAAKSTACLRQTLGANQWRIAIDSKVSMHPLFLLSGTGMMVVAIAAVWYWKKYSGVLWSFLLWGSLAWAIGVTLKAAASIPTPAIINQVRDALPPHFADPVLWIYIGLLTGIFECGATFAFAYIHRIREANWNEAVGFGVGFGAIEALLVGVGYFLMVLVVIFIPDKLPPELLKFATAGSDSLWVIPAPIVERAIVIPLHALSCVLIIYAVRTRTWRWFWLSFAYKTVVDAIAGYIHLTYGLENLTTLDAWIVELVFLPFGVVGILGLYGFRRRWQLLSVEPTE